MKGKSILISMSIILSSLLFDGCSTDQSHTSNTSNVSHKTSGETQSGKKKKNQVNTHLLNFLDITKKDFKTERNSGKSIAVIAKEKNKSEQQVIDFLMNQRAEVLKKKNPNISTDKLNSKKQSWTKKIKEEVEKKKQKKGE